METKNWHYSKLVFTDSRMDSLCSLLKIKKFWPSVIKVLLERVAAKKVLICWGQYGDSTVEELVQSLTSIGHTQAVSLLNKWITEDTLYMQKTFPEEAVKLCKQGEEYYRMGYDNKAMQCYQEAADMDYPPAFLRLYKMKKDPKYETACKTNEEWFAAQAEGGDAGLRETWDFIMSCL